MNSEKLHKEPKAKNTKDDIEEKIKNLKLNSPKYIRDPIHDIIKIEDKVVLDLIDSAPFQRLKHIKQLPFGFFVYPGATHTRFLHSLGTYHLAIRLMNRLGIENEEDRLAVKIAALLHDIGHGPFSHLFEAFLEEIGYGTKSERKHERWTTKIIKENKEIQEILKLVSDDFSDKVCWIIEKSYKDKKYLSEIVSSQFDSDRLDYMLRDSYMTGVKYGRYDLNWLLRTLTMGMRATLDIDYNVVGKEDRIVIDGVRGQSCLEEYLLGNFYLYKHVYFHKAVIAVESMLILALKRAALLIKKGKMPEFTNDAFIKISNKNNISILEYLSLNDSELISWLCIWVNSSDEELGRLCNGILNRKLYKTIKAPREYKHDGRIKEIFEKNNINFDSNFIEREVGRIAYKGDFFFKNKQKSPQEIYIKIADEDIESYDTLSKNDKLGEISKSISYLKLDYYFVVVPREIHDEIENIIKGDINE
jgi:hypothetical protein